MVRISIAQNYHFYHYHYPSVVLSISILIVLAGSVGLNSMFSLVCTKKLLFWQWKGHFQDSAQSALQIPYGNSHLEMGVWKCGALGVCIWLFLKNFFSNFLSHIKNSKWGRKCISINFTSCNGSPQQIPVRFTNGKLPHSCCRAFWALLPRAPLVSIGTQKRFTLRCIIF